MLCKILRPETAQTPQPVMWPVHGSVSRRGFPEDEPAAAAALRAEAEQANQLRSRIAELERKLQTELPAARDAAFREGEKSGREQAAREFEPVMERMSRSLAELATLRDRIRRDAEKDLVSLAIAIAKRILYRELSVDPDAIRGLVKAALDKSQNRDLCRIRLHPGHERHVRAYLQTAGLIQGVDVVADAALPFGGVVLETRCGDVDASIDTQLSEIERGFADRMAR